jgi:hypothetical protein
MMGMNTRQSVFFYKYYLGVCVFRAGGGFQPNLVREKVEEKKNKKWGNVQEKRGRN